MDKRIINFMLIAVAVLFGYQLLVGILFPPEPKPVPEVVEKQPDDPDAEPPVNVAPEDDPDDKIPADEPAEKEDETTAETKEPAQPGGRPAGVELRAEQPQRIQLGSLAADSPYRMLVTINTTGAAIERAELKSLQYRDIEDRSGYWGHLALTDSKDSAGAVVGIVGPGTPAADAGIEPGDIISKIGTVEISGVEDVAEVLKAKIGGDSIDVTVFRDGKQQPPLTVALTRRPLEIMRPELIGERYDIGDTQNADPLSLLLTLQRVGDKKIGEKEIEIPDIDLYRSQWWILDEPTAKPNTVALVKELPEFGLRLLKRYRLAELPAGVESDDNVADPPAYHLLVDVEIHNIGSKAIPLAYRLDGPTGLPSEGWWYSARTSRNWTGGAGARDVVVQFLGKSAAQSSARVIAKKTLNGEEESLTWGGQPLGWAAVDAQYFAAALIPQKKSPDEQWLSSVEASVAGDLLEAKRSAQTNVTCRLISETQTIEPDSALRHEYLLFAGPKNPELLKLYAPPAAPDEDLGELIFYGWPIWGYVARRMSQVLHFFYSIVGNYGIAIIMLTVLVRACMFPISRKQAMNAQKMQELQPEMKKIGEKYKNDYEKRGKAIQELQRKHNYNPLAGCLPMFIQLPIFIGLYRALMVDVELRDAPLISETFGWARNLGAPDMLWFWEPYMPAFLAAETGFLGPYLNILPLITVGLFIWQQKMFMPPAADENQAMQQKVMRFMMVFMGFFFFRVASGLCLYFIASSLWGIAERKLLPKTIAAKPDDKAVTAGKESKPDTSTKSEKKKSSNSQSNNGKSGTGKKNRRRQKGKS